MSVRVVDERGNVTVADEADLPTLELRGYRVETAEEGLGRAYDAGTAERFGGIDIVINNASAISLTPTESTPIRRFDLMMGVNARGTFLVTQTCLPHLKQSAAAGRSPHVLTLAPPPNLDARWFAPHVAYTLAKVGMSLCVLGHAEEFRPLRIGVNALWPRTVIQTAALQMIPGGRPEHCRSVDIMADAGHAIFLKKASAFSGNFLIDDSFLYERGVRDFEKYSVDPGKTLMPDFFVPADSVPPPGVVVG